MHDKKFWAEIMSLPSLDIFICVGSVAEIVFFEKYWKIR
jgi:hypothetical protein